MIVGGIQFNPSVMGIAAAAVLGGIVAAGSNHSTAKEATHELTAADAKRTALIGQLALRLVSQPRRLTMKGPLHCLAAGAKISWRELLPRRSARRRGDCYAQVSI